MRIIALDPGGTTGVATYVDGEWEHFQIGPEEHHVQLYTFLGEFKPEVIIYERFMYQRRELTRGVSLNLDAVEYIGIVKLYYLLVDWTIELVCQTPHQAKKFWTDDKLKTVGLYITGAPHANDATRHLLYYLVVNRGERQWVMKLRPPVDPTDQEADESD